MTFRTEAVQSSKEYHRIVGLPRRDPVIAEDVMRQLTELLRTPTGTMTLRPVQALALHDIGTVGGLFGPIRVGGGKTLISLLAPRVLESQRPLLLLPASLLGKTVAEKNELMKHWRIPRHTKIWSYQALGRTGMADELERYRPDLIVMDEGHRTKNPKAAVTRRLIRYLKAHPETHVVIMSGSLIKHSLRDFSNGAAWSLKDGAPVPLEWEEVEAWANALDEKVNPISRLRPGVLGHDMSAAREWFQHRLLATPGVVSTQGDDVGASLVITGIEAPVNEITEANFRRLRDEWATPDGYTYSLATDIWRHARELALGLHYVWDPRPQDEWLEARSAWSKICRKAIKDSMYTDAPLDSEKQVVKAVDAGELDDGGALDEWRKIEPTFTINSKPVWHDDSALNACAAWMEEHKGIVWCEHTFFGHELSKRTGAPYYGAKAQDAKGNQIKDAKGARPVIASALACGTGQNLQAFHENLITSLQPGADTNEQLIGRTHRDGQDADEVTVDILVLCAEHQDAWDKLHADATMAEQMMGQAQKILIADVASWPAPRMSKGRWRRTTQEDDDE